MYLLLICIIHRRHVAAQHRITSQLEFILCQLCIKQGEQGTSLVAPSHEPKGVPTAKEVAEALKHTKHAQVHVGGRVKAPSGHEHDATSVPDASREPGDQMTDEPPSTT
jgi:hypothetical protein